MIQTLLRHKLILIGGVILIAGGVWFGMSGNTKTPALETTPIQGSVSPVGQELVASLLTLRAVKLEGTILTDPSFMSLKDFSTQIVPEAVGRENPFAPLVQGASPSANSTKSDQIFTPRR